MSGWKKADLAERASDVVKDVCCGRQDCFGGRGCSTAQWLTAKLTTKGYRIIRKPRLVPAHPEDKAP